MIADRSQIAPKAERTTKQPPLSNLGWSIWSHKRLAFPSGMWAAIVSIFCPCRMHGEHLKYLVNATQLSEQIGRPVQHCAALMAKLIVVRGPRIALPGTLRAPALTFIKGKLIHSRSRVVVTAESLPCSVPPSLPKPQTGLVSEVHISGKAISSPSFLEDDEPSIAGAIHR